MLRKDYIFAGSKLLIVDDEPRLRESVSALLRSRFSQVHTCDGGQPALSQLMAGGIDLMLLDLHLGDINGLDLLAMIRRAGIDTAVLVVSGDIAIDSAIGALRLGATDFLRKPYEPEELLHRVDMALQRRHLKLSNQEMAHQLHHSERMHRALVEASPDLIFTLDANLCFTFINDRSHDLIGYSQTDLLGRSILSTIVPADIERVRYALEFVGTQRMIEFRVVCRRDEAETRHFEVNLVPIELDSMLLSDGSVRTSRLYGIARDVTDKKRTQEQLTYLAYHDVLTGLPNRVLFRDRLGLALVQAKRSGSKVATMFVDLDHFKLANDTFGHLKGDELLKQAAYRLHQILRETDTLARVGGDEFTILLSDPRSKEDAGFVASKLVSAVATPFLVDGHEVFLTASVGIAMYPEDGEDIETLLRHADIAMYNIKALGRNGFGFFLPIMDETSSRRLGLESEIRCALEQKQFVLHYQPQVDAKTRQLVGYEALIRWRHPTKGLMLPSTFLDIVEDIGMMTVLTYWVIKEACQAMHACQRNSQPLPRLSVNVPPVVLAENDFCEYLIATLDRYGIAHPSFEIEITENAFIADPQTIALKLASLAMEGVRVAIDDFGTQYSSLNYLRHLPVTALKIDQSFVREIKKDQEDSPIVRAIVAIATGLSLHLIAEGVETEIQASFLESLGVHEMQGYLFGKPKSLDMIDPVNSLESLR
ncbi:MAG: EAL domain-containing protein [Formivibrio sp.]|nr:EAL domain-containing protein [Formivibrio sp.]